MRLGMSLAAFPQFHVVFEPRRGCRGVLVLFARLAGRRLPVMTALFLLTPVLTDVTGFMFPRTFDAAGGNRVPGFPVRRDIRLLRAPPRRCMAGVYAVGATGTVYLKILVLVVQLFQKVPPIHPAGPDRQ